MSQPIQRQADQWSLPDRQASSTYEPSQDELRDLLGGPRIQAGLLNTREASRKHADQIPSAGYPEDLKEHPEFQKWLAEHPNWHEWLDEKVLYPIWLQEHQNVGPGRVTEASQRLAVPRENPAGDLNMSPRKLDQQVTQQVTNKALKPPKPKPIPDDLGQDQSFKVPNQLKAHVDPPLPRRGYLAAFMRHADGESDKKKNPFSGEINTNPLGGARGTGSGQSYGPNQTPIAPVATGTGSAGTSGPKTYGPSSDYKPGGAEPGWEGGATSTSQPPAGSPSPNAPTQTSDESPTSATTVSDTKPSTGTGGGGGAPSGGGGGGATGGGWQARDIAPGSIDTSKPYTVQSGDTLAEIAQGAGIKDYNDIAKSNNIADPNKIDVGQQINFSPSPGGPSTSVSDTPDVSGVAGADFVRGNAPDMAEAGPGGIPLGATSPTPIPEAGGGTGAPPPPPNQVKANRFVDPPLPPKGQLKKFWAGSRRLADTTNENPGWFDDQKKNGPKPPLNTDPGLTNPAAPPGGIEPPKTPSQKAGEPVKPPPATPAPSQPTSPNTPASSDATQAAPGKTNDLAGASNPTSPKSGPPGGNNPSPNTPQGPMDQPKTPGTYGPDLGNGVSLSDAMGVIGGIGQGINTALSAVGTIGSGLMGALSGGGLSGLISGFGGLGMLGSSLGITAAAQQQIEASERAVKEQYV